MTRTNDDVKILFDFRSYQESWDRGVGRYIRALFNELNLIAPSSLKIVISNTMPMFDDLKKYNHYVYEENDRRIGIYDFFINGNMFTSKEILDEIFPKKYYTQCKSVVSILYDLIPMIFPKNYLGQKKRDAYLKQFEVFSMVDHIFSISDATTKDGIKFLNRPIADFTTIYGGADAAHWRTSNSDSEYSFKNRENSLVFVTGADKRKNYHGAARCFAKALSSGKIPKNSKLYLICRICDSFTENVRIELQKFDDKIRKNIIITDYIPDNELKNILEKSKASIFPSFYEGLGLPILESYLAGTPAFASKISATREFVSEEASFDPYDDDDMVNTIVRIFNDEAFCKRSLEFGRALAQQVNWNSAASKFYKKLVELKGKAAPVEKRIAVYSTLPPDESGIATYSAKTHAYPKNIYDLFSDFKTLKDYKKCLALGLDNVFPNAAIPWFEKFSTYYAKLFVIGNSPHNSPALKEAIRTKGERNRFLYLHEAQTRGAWHGVETLKKIDNSTNLADTKFMVYKLIELSGIKNIFVNNELARDLIYSDLPAALKKDVLIDILFLPIEDLRHVKKQTMQNINNGIIIGTFGFPGKAKATDILIEAATIMRSRGTNINLIIAGYESKNYLKNLDNTKKRYVRALEPDEKSLFSLMKSVDLAIQLRTNPHGESSGCVAQLIGMQQKLITTEGFISSELSRYCSALVPAQIQAEQLADAIELALDRKQVNVFTKYDEYSFPSLARLIKEKIDSYLDRHSPGTIEPD